MKQIINGIEYDIAPLANLRGADLRGAKLSGCYVDPLEAFEARCKEVYPDDPEEAYEAQIAYLKTI